MELVYHKVSCPRLCAPPVLCAQQACAPLGVVSLLKALCEASAAGMSDICAGASPSCFMMLVAAAIIEEASPALAGTMMVLDFRAISCFGVEFWGGAWRPRGEGSLEVNGWCISKCWDEPRQHLLWSLDRCYRTSKPQKTVTYWVPLHQVTNHCWCGPSPAAPSKQPPTAQPPEDWQLGALQRLRRWRS